MGQVIDMLGWINRQIAAEERLTAKINGDLDWDQVLDVRRPYRGTDPCGDSEVDADGKPLDADGLPLPW
jgi:hypothetical protein